MIGTESSLDSARLRQFLAEKMDVDARMIKAILFDENIILPVSTMLNGEYGESGVCIKSFMTVSISTNMI